MFDTLRSIFTGLDTNKKIVTVTSGANYAELPKGFFNVETASGKKSLGYNGSFFCFDCGLTVVDGAQRITLDKPRSALPLVKLNFVAQQAAGTVRVGSHTVVDTESLDQFDGHVQWDGAPMREGVDYV